jgi:hypothetical protein
MNYDPIPTATVDHRGRVVCPVCQVKIPVPVTHSLSAGVGKCPNGHSFFVDDVAVEAFHHFVSKNGIFHSKELLKNHEEIDNDVKRIITEGWMFEP